MDLAVAAFVQQALGSGSGTWDVSAIRGLGELSPPTSLGGATAWLLRGDVNALWGRWFLEGLADPALFTGGRLQYPHLLKQVRDSVAAMAVTMPADEQREVARRLSDLLYAEVERRIAARRIPLQREGRLLLWELYPRCWICGGEFPDWARSRFLGEMTDAAEPIGRPFVDFFRPRGVRPTDLRIEIEHVVAHAHGGATDLSNLRLACGWCNRAKGARTLLYDAEGTTRLFDHPTAGAISIPQPFWVVRLLAMRPRCEDPSGCVARTSAQELTVAPRRIGGSPNPSNLMVVCNNHDPLQDIRLIAARFIK